MADEHRLHITHEVVRESSKAESIAKAKASQGRYKYYANALLLGYPKLEPYDPIYLTGLTDNMNGMWVVISIVHRINLAFPYTMSVKIGTNDEIIKLVPDRLGDILDTSHSLKAVLNHHPDDGVLGKPFKKTGKHVFRTNEFIVTPIPKDAYIEDSTSQMALYKKQNNLRSGEKGIVGNPNTHTPHISKKASYAKWVRE